jgi:imidazolonepropionase
LAADAATRVLRDIDVLLTMDPGLGEGPLGEIRDGAVAFDGHTITWVGRSVDAPDAPDVVSLPGTIGLPGLVDCHTHAVWAGSRADEYRRRLAGERYDAILAAGGGILSTVRATRAASEDELVHLATARLRRMRDRGVTTVEIKSGYGLAPEPELRILRAARRAGEAAGVRVVRTFLGAHAVPAEHRGDREAYVREILEVQLPAVAAEADLIDAYVDRAAFTVEEGERVLRAGRALGLGVRIHAEQVSHTGAAAMAAGLGATSADHLERIDAAGIEALAAAGTVAVLLPAAMISLRDRPPPVAALREAGVPFAVATDLNPGTSPMDDLWLAASLACLTLGLTVEEALRGITVEAARALGLTDRGRLAPGLLADVLVVEPPPGEPMAAAPLIQFWSGARVRARYLGGAAT